MNITLNGDARAIPDGLSVEGLLQHLGIVSKKVAVERNLEIVPKSTVMTRSGRWPGRNLRCGLNATRTVFAPRFRASASAPHTKGVRPLAAMPTTTSRRLTPR